jgi:hypothetical protein
MVAWPEGGHSFCFDTSQTSEGFETIREVLSTPNPVRLQHPPRVANNYYCNHYYIILLL